jgi:hypothetical protein
MNTSQILVGLCLVLAMAASAALASPSTVLYVSPRGNDAWSGKLAEPDRARADGPFATLARARHEVRNLTAADRLGDGVSVRVRAGTYELSETFVLTAANSGTEKAPVVYEAYPGERPVLLGGRTIGNFVPYRGKILKADMTAARLAGVYFRQLFYSGERQHLARYPNFDPKNPYGGGWSYVDGKLVPMYAELPGDDKRTLHYREGDMLEMARPTEAEVFIFPRYNWWNNVVPIAGIDRATRTVTLAGDCSYAIRPGDRYYVRNVFEALDSPGEWYLDRETWTLYFRPPGPIRAGSVSVPVLETLITMRGVANVTIRGFVIEGCDGNGVVLEDCQRCVIAGNVIRNTVGRWDWGLSAVVVSGGSHNSVVGNDIHDTGGHGISLSGGDRKTLTPADNVADNNYIHHVGQMYKQGVGISMTGVGLAATHNLIHDGPRMGIMFSGNNLLMEFNEIRHMNLETEDTGAVYTGGRDWISSRGTVIRHNYFHDILGYGHDETGRWESPRFAWGVYLDDNAGGVDVIGNVLVRCPRALVHLHNGRDNVIENNIMVGGTLQQLEYNGWTDKHPYWQSHFKTMLEGYNMVKDQPAWKAMRHMDIGPEQAVLPDGTIMAHNVFRRNIVYYNSPTAQLYRLSSVNLDHNEFGGNLVYNAGGPLLLGLEGIAPEKQWAEWQRRGMDVGSVNADPMFVNPSKDDYRLRRGSPALRLGFQPIPIERIGPYKSPLRATWPIVEAEGAREHPLVSEPPRPAPPPEPRYAEPVAIPRVLKALVIGRDPSTWPGAALRLAETPGRTPAASPPCVAKVAYDTRYLYVGLTVPLRPEDKLSRGEQWGRDDGAEVCVQGVSGGKPGPVFAIHGFLSGKHESVTEAGAPFEAARAVGEGTRYTVNVSGTRWAASWAIPWSALGVTPKRGATLAFNMAVRRAAADEWIQWAGTMAQTWKLEQAGAIVLQ